MAQVIEAGPEIGTVEFPEGMSDEEMSSALEGELERLHNMPSVRVTTPAPGASEIGAMPRSAVEEAQILSQQEAPKEPAGRRELDPEEEERSARESILQRQYDAAVQIAEPAERERQRAAILGAMRANGFTVVKPEEGPMEAASHPTIAFPKFGENPEDSTALKMGKGAVNALSGVAEFFTSPLGIATLGTGSLPAGGQRLVAGAFAADMARQSPEILREMQKAVENGNAQRATELALTAGATMYFAAKSGEHAVGRMASPGQVDPTRVAGLIGEQVLENIRTGRIAAESPNDIAMMLADPRAAQWFVPKGGEAQNVGLETTKRSEDTAVSAGGEVAQPGESVASARSDQSGPGEGAGNAGPAGREPEAGAGGEGRAVLEDEARAALLKRKGVWEASTPQEGKRVAGIWTVVDAGDLVTSADQGFDQALQPRDRSREASQNQIAEIVRRFEPERLADAPTTDLGAPIIDEHNQVLSGNGRAAALRQIYGSENQSKAEAYRQFISKRAQELGLPADAIAAIQKMKAPVLARQVSDWQGLSKEEFARQSNQQQVLGMGEAEKAANDAQVVEKILDLWPSEEGDVLAASNRDFLNAFVKGTGDQAELLTKEGYNAGALRRRVQNAVMGTLVGPDATGRELMGHLLENGDALGLRSVVNGVMNAAPRLIKLRAVRPEYDPAATLRKALIDLVNLRREGVRVEDYVKQMDLLEDPARSRESDFLVEQLANARSARAVTEGLNRYAERAMQQAPKSGDMFGVKPVGQGELLRAAFAKPKAGTEAGGEVDRKYEVYQGRGKSREEIYGEENVKRGAGVPLFGSGQYYALKSADATRYGKVTQHTIELGKPFILDSDAKWFRLIREADTPHLDNMAKLHYTEPEKIPAAAEKLQAHLKGKGFDGIIVRLQNGDGTKRLRAMVAHDQIVKFAERSAATKQGELVEAMAGEPVALPTREFTGETMGLKRKQAQAWARKNLPETVRNAETGWEIRISRAGIDKTTSGQRHFPEEHLEAVRALPALIERAGLRESRPDRRGDPNIKAIHIFEGKVDIGGRNFKAKLTVKETRDGRFFYDHSLSEVSRPAGIAADDTSGKAARPTSTAGPKSKIAESGEEATIEESTLPRRIESETPGPEPGEPVGLADIRQYLEKALDIPIRLRGYARRALGLFRANPETIRMRALNDITTIAHEVGHYLHYLLFPSSGPVKGPRPLLTKNGASDFGTHYDGELLPLGKRTSKPSYLMDQVRREGVAEWFREWLTDRSQAFVKAPAFARFFEESLQRDYPNVWTIVERARQDLKRYINQPAELKVDSRIDRKGDRERRSVMEWWNELVDDWHNELYPIQRALQKLADFGLPPKHAQMVYDLAENYIGGWRGKVEYALYQRQIDLDGNDVGPSLRTILGGIDDTREFGNYLVAKRELELEGRGIRTGLRPEEVDEQRRWVGTMYEKYAVRAMRLYEFQRNQLALLRDSGLISADQFTKMTAANHHYVPFFRVMEYLTGTGARKGEGFINLSPGVGRLKGSDRKYVDPLESVLKNAYVFRDLAERNKVARAFVDAVEMVRGGGRVAEGITKKVRPITVKGEEIEGKVRAELEAAGIDLPEDPLLEGVTFNIWRAAKQSSPKEGKFTVWENGKERVYQVGDEHLYRSLALADSNDAAFFSKIPFLKAMRAFTRVKRAGATLSLEFMARNPWRDQISAAMNSNYGFVPFWDGFRGMLSALGKDKLYWEWVKSGGRYADFISMDRKDLQSHLKDVIREPSVLREALRLANPLNVINNLQRFSEVMEQATRIAEFRNAKRAGATDLAAANASKEVTLNFSKAGFKGKLINQLVAFFNAGILDVAKVAEMHRKYPLRTAMRGMMYIGLPSAMAWWLGRDDERIQNLPEWRKIGFWNVNVTKNLGLPGPFDEDLVLSFPKPFLYGQIYGTSMEKGLDYAYGKDPNAVRKWFQALLQASPLTVNSVLPSAVQPLIENWANKSFFRGEKLENDTMQELPAYLRFNAQTSLIARKLGALVPIDGGYSPIKIDNTVRGYFAALGKYGLDAADWTLARIEGENLPAEPAKSIWERPLLRGFARSPYEPSAYVNRFYDGIEAAEQRVNGFKLLGKTDTADARKFFEKNGKEILWYAADVGGKSMLTRLRDARENLGEILKAMREVQNSRVISPEEKRRRLVELGKLRDGIAEAAYKTYLAPADRKKLF